MKKIILQLCADTGSDTKPWKDAWYEVILIWKDIWVENYHPPKNVYWIIANPPCTNFSSVRTSAKIPRDEEEWMRLVRECQRIIEEANPIFRVIENPATWLLKKYLWPPKFIYQPWEFWSPRTKKTALRWEFNIPQKIYNRREDVPKNNNLYIRPWRTKPGMVYLHKSSIKYIPEFSCFNVDSDMELRSLCSQWFAKEFYNVNRPKWQTTKR